jgi:hypothetical protein
MMSCRRPGRLCQGLQVIGADDLLDFKNADAVRLIVDTFTFPLFFFTDQA